MNPPAWLTRLTARLRRQRQVQALVQCLHPDPPGFSACVNKVTTCLTCKAKFKC